MSIKEFGVLLALGAIWGASFLFIKVGGKELEPFVLVEMRLGLAALVMLAVAATRSGTYAALRANWRPLVVMGVLNCALPYTLLTWGEKYISSGLASIYNSTAPLWAATLGLFWSWGERLSPGRLVGVFIGLLGVILVVSGNLEGGESSQQLLGHVAVLLMALSYAVAGIFGRRTLRGVPSLVPATGQLVTGALILLPLAVLQLPKQAPSTVALGAVVTLAVVGTALASLMYWWLIARVGATKALLVTYLLPGFALMWGALLLDEPITMTAILGLALVLIGITITSGLGAPVYERLRGSEARGQESEVSKAQR